MPNDVRLPLTVGTEALPDIHWTWDVRTSPERLQAKGSCMVVEVPAMVELLRLIADGKVTAAEAADAVENLAEAIDKRLSAREHH
ncbi:hypothetical protein OG280_40875 (plasmid) [Streptomyces virginiae]|uniref:hypothetical protein n=1 Tax=Streptomyces virginiae TaxID=1961 RepID=UPI002DD80554|nr:hypothetical protein [Streptomyces virginiae]WSC82751.1 hypothetical protein OHA56_40845 [Streptomyces virginiae]